MQPGMSYFSEICLITANYCCPHLQMHPCSNPRLISQIAKRNQDKTMNAQSSMTLRLNTFFFFLMQSAVFECILMISDALRCRNPAALTLQLTGDKSHSCDYFSLHNSQRICSFFLKRCKNIRRGQQLFYANECSPLAREGRKMKATMRSRGDNVIDAST